MIGNNKGSSTLESAIIVPMMILIIVSFVMLLLTTYDYGVELLDEVNMYIDDHEKIDLQGEIRGITFKKSIRTTYKSHYIDVKMLQDCVEYLIYQAKSYGHMLEKNDEQ